MRITNLNDDYTIEYAPRIYYAFSVNVTLEVLNVWNVTRACGEFTKTVFADSM